ncbi:MmgE/PrpD family protein [Chloroflexota bacterium]
MNETKELVTFLAGLSYDDLSVEVIDTAKLCLLDTLGVGLFASKMEWTKIVAETMAKVGGVPESVVWGFNMKTPAHYASLINGTAAHGIEMDDRHPSLSMHTGAMTIPAALAVCEKAYANGKTMLMAIVVGYEAAFRVGKSVPLQIDRGLHPAGHKGVWGSVAAVSKALSLNNEQTLDAFGIAGSLASGILEFSKDSQRNMVKRFHGGWASHNGVIASLLAQNGLTAPRTVLEGTFGYCNVFKGSVEPRFEELTKELGKHFQILEREVKSYAAWGGSHVCIDAVAQAKAQYQIKPQQIDRIAVAGTRALLGSQHLQEPQSVMAAQFSLPFIIAMAFYRDLRDPSVWTEEVLADNAILALSHRIDCHIDEDRERVFQESLGAETAGVAVKFKLKDGREEELIIHDAKGARGNPMTAKDIHNKFSLLAGHILPQDKVKEITRVVDSLEELDDMRKLSELLLG